jgi:hypothetical protein
MILHRRRLRPDRFEVTAEWIGSFLEAVGRERARGSARKE